MSATLREKPFDTLQRWLFNCYPAHWFSGGKMAFLSSDYRYCKVILRKNWRTRGLFGNIFGGNLYAGIDAMPMALLKKRLGHDRFVVWDRSGEINYLKPAYCKMLVAEIHLPDEIFNVAMSQIEQGEAAHITFSFDLTCPRGTLYARVTKVVHVECKTRFLKRKSQPEKTPR